jgi:glycosyltransferase involved in cell wall biosynthesis
MRILFVLAYYHPYIGGAERIAKRLAEGLVQRGHSVRVITTHLPGTAYFEEINGVEIERVQVPRFADRYFFSILSAPTISKRARDYDLVHTTSNNITVAAFLAARVFRLPIVLTCYEVLGKKWKLVESHPLKSRVYRNIEKMIVKFPYDRCITTSQATYNDALQVGVKPVHTAVIYSGVDEIFYRGSLSYKGKLRTLCGASEEDFLYVYVGRPGVTKGVDHLLRAAPSIQSEIRNGHLALILAKDPREQYLRLCRMIDEIGSSAKVHLIPPTHDREQLVQYLLDANCVVVPSLTEGFGLTTAEACALGIPVVATQVGSIPEVISGRYILIEPGCAEAISQGVIQAWRGEYDWKDLKQFSWAEMVAGYEKVYEELLA